ncbi:MAG: hypothetical protein V4582_00050 [Pseudomonadota bacterium]
MRDRRDIATLELPGFAAATAAPPSDTKRASAGRARKPALRQEQLELLEATDATGLPLWRRDDGLDASGLPVWARS